MKIFDNRLELKAFLKKYKANNLLKIGFVPTMGNLHQGHMQLIEAARTQNDLVVCSVFINPLQFEAHEDLKTYPVKVENDLVYINIF